MIIPTIEEALKARQDADDKANRELQARIQKAYDEAPQRAAELVEEWSVGARAGRPSYCIDVRNRRVGEFVEKALKDAGWDAELKCEDGYANVFIKLPDGLWSDVFKVKR